MQISLCFGEVAALSSNGQRCAAETSGANDVDRNRSLGGAIEGCGDGAAECNRPSILLLGDRWKNPAPLRCSWRVKPNPVALARRGGKRPGNLDATHAFNAASGVAFSYSDCSGFSRVAFIEDHHR